MSDFPAKHVGQTSKPPSAPRVNLVAKVAKDLRSAIRSGSLSVGTKLPSESALTEEHNVSRTVIREAVAWLRADGLVEARQGAGVYVIASKPAAGQPFQSADSLKISSIIELLELRTAVEIEAAGLAAKRRSPAQEEAVIERCHTIEHMIKAGEPTTKADFVLHLTIADATNNARFRECLELLGERIIPRSNLRDESLERAPAEYLEQIQAEHRQIADAISRQDAETARSAMRRHLEGSQSRYRLLLRRN